MRATRNWSSVRTCRQNVDSERIIYDQIPQSKLGGDHHCCQLDRHNWRQRWSSSSIGSPRLSAASRPDDSCQGQSAGSSEPTDSQACWQTTGGNESPGHPYRLRLPCRQSWRRYLRHHNLHFLLQPSRYEVAQRIHRWKLLWHKSRYDRSHHRYCLLFPGFSARRCNLCWIYGHHGELHPRSIPGCNRSSSMCYDALCKDPVPVSTTHQRSCLSVSRQEQWAVVSMSLSRSAKLAISVVTGLTLLLICAVVEGVTGNHGLAIAIGMAGAFCLAGSVRFTTHHARRQSLPR